jgi:hypothetical protein
MTENRFLKKIGAVSRSIDVEEDKESEVVLERDTKEEERKSKKYEAKTLLFPFNKCKKKYLFHELFWLLEGEKSCESNIDETWLFP